MEAKEDAKRVQEQARRSYGEVERPSRYLDETDSGTDDLQTRHPVYS